MTVGRTNGKDGTATLDPRSGSSARGVDGTIGGVNDQHGCKLLDPTFGTFAQDDDEAVTRASNKDGGVPLGPGLCSSTSGFEGSKLPLCSVCDSCTQDVGGAFGPPKDRGGVVPLGPAFIFSARGIDWTVGRESSEDDSVHFGRSGVRV